MHLKEHGSLDGYIPEKAFKGLNFSHISIHNERRMLQMLMSVCLQALCKYPSTLKQDQERISSTKLSWTEKNILTLVMEEKQLLHKMINNADKSLVLIGDGMTVKKAR